MFDSEKLKEVLVQYKNDFNSTWWNKEKFKWENVKWFQEHWDINASDFTEMLSISLSKTSDLLASSHYYPRTMIIELSQVVPEETRSLFIDLFDETKDVFERIDTFKNKSWDLFRKYKNSEAETNFETENAISVYLWLRYPDKYYIYKYGEIKNVADELQCSYPFKKGRYKENIQNFLKFYDEIREELKKDTELITLVKSNLSDDCYEDLNLNTLSNSKQFWR